MKINWQTKKLGEACEIYQPKTISKNEMVIDGDYLVYGANGVIGRYNKYNHEDSELLITCRGATCGSVNISTPKSWINGNAMVVRPIDTLSLDKNYLKYYFLGGIDINSAISGSAQPQITREKLSPLEIPLPPLAIQKKIVERLDELLGNIAQAKHLRQEAIADTEKILSQTLREIFEEGKEKFEMTNLGNVATLVRGPFGGSLKKEIFVPTGIAVYEQGNVIDNILDNFRYFITSEKFEEMKRFEVSAGDILMSCSGTIGKFVIIPNNFIKGIINQALLKITPKKTITVDYLKYALQDYLSQSTNHIKGGAIKNIASVKELKEFQIPLPPLPEQHEIVIRLDTLSAKLRELRQLQAEQLEDFKKLEKAYLREAFSGELV